ncbi:MAG: hypothetical protein Q4D16_14820 [Eubacteriales bacterium]|nr:hypothetical protein [Eubacteriales bacterium]
MKNAAGIVSGGKTESDIGFLVRDRKLFYKEAVFFAFLLVFITWIMFYVFYIRDGVLYSGFTVYGDYAPHTAMMRSFSWGNNFPTQYPHYGGADVKYHFMFQFLTGNLEYLGIRLDFAYNIVSIFSLLGFLMILYKLAGRIVGGFAGGVLASLFFFFRSGTAFFRFAWEHLKAGDLWITLAENTSFLGYTPNEDWGLWNFNVYLNQRHLAFGLLLVAAALWIYLDWLEAGTSHEEKGLIWIKNRLFTKTAWKSRSLDTAMMVGLLLGLSSFWNGAAVIGGLLILMGFAVFSDGKLDYAVTAAVAVLFTMLQSKIFVNGSVMSPSLYLGFLAEDKTIWGIIWYVAQISGFFFLGLFLPALFLKRRERAVMVSFLFPAVFAFVVSLTPDINVNHKYVMISYAFLTMFWAFAAVKLFAGRRRYKAAAVILVICLSLNGVYDFVVILKDNDSRHRVAVEADSPLSKWISGNLDKDDLILTPEYSMNEVTMSGAMMYCGWPYYAWSAGYDTSYRAEKAVVIYTTRDTELLKSTVEQEGIDYILFEENMEFEQQACREDIIAQTYPMVYNSEDGRIRIYET